MAPDPTTTLVLDPFNHLIKCVGFFKGQKEKGVTLLSGIVVFIHFGVGPY
jgi:hypothetical protein